MDRAEAERRVAELRELDPRSFSHPECREGEIWINSYFVEIIDEVVEGLHKKGCSSARAGKHIQAGRRGVFADAIEVVMMDALETSVCG